MHVMKHASALCILTHQRKQWQCSDIVIEYTFGPCNSFLFSVKIISFTNASLVVLSMVDKVSIMKIISGSFFHFHSPPHCCFQVTPGQLPHNPLHLQCEGVLFYRYIWISPPHCIWWSLQPKWRQEKCWLYNVEVCWVCWLTLHTWLGKEILDYNIAVLVHLTYSPRLRNTGCGSRQQHGFRCQYPQLHVGMTSTSFWKTFW